MELLPKSRLILQGSSDKSNRSTPPTENTDESEKASPTDFMAFLPWACQQYELDVYVEMSRLEQTKYVSRVENIQVRGKNSKHVGNIVSGSGKAIASKYSQDSDLFIDENKLVRIALTYCDDQLVQIKIDKTKHLPREILVIIQIIIKFYPLLTSFSINSGADKYTIHEMCKVLTVSNITELNFDNTFIKEANYDLVLDHSKQLKVLSLCRCQLDDHVVEKISSKLEYPSHASNTLSILNLSSNRLTNRGAQFLSKMLRTNRCLSYLNVAGNMINDKGAEAILNVLNKFCLTLEEKLIVRGKYLKYLKKRQLLIDEHMKIFREAGPRKKKITKSNAGLKKPSNSNLKKSSSDNLRSRSLSNTAGAYEKALKKAKIVCGEFNDPFGKDTVSEDGSLVSNGNNFLAYLNIAYNNISHSSVMLLLKVLKHQKALARTPRGLVAVSLEGNPLPESTPELLQIDSILHGALAKDKSLVSTAGSKRKINTGSSSAGATKV